MGHFVYAVAGWVFWLVVGYGVYFLRRRKKG